MISPSQNIALIQGELADLRLYQSLRKKASGDFADMLEAFIATEEKHVSFWQKTFGIKKVSLTLTGRARNSFIQGCVLLFGESAGYLLLEAVESHGIRQYLRLWKQVKDEKVRNTIRQILIEELEHEDIMATGGTRTVNAGFIRNAFLGFNDGSVEILGAVSGLAAALGSPTLIAVSAGTVSVAGAISMAAGAFLSTHAEKELEDMEAAKQLFLKQEPSPLATHSPWKSAYIVGIGYMVGAAVPVAPFFFGATNPWWSIGLSGTLILCVSMFLSFLSGMDIRRRIGLNLGVIILAVLISYAIGNALDAFMH
jgi:predicted membrane protein (TIGR00267 family)